MIRSLSAPGLALLVAFSAPAIAQQAPASTEVRASQVEVGDTTRNLLDIQRNGSQAGPMLPLTGDQATLGYARYMRSFTHSLPEFFSTISTGSPLRGGAGSQPVNGQ